MVPAAGNPGVELVSAEITQGCAKAPRQMVSRAERVVSLKFTIAGSPKDMYHGP